jgi:hypothetical protein
MARSYDDHDVCDIAPTAVSLSLLPMSDGGRGKRWSEARLVAHWAAQIVAAVGETLVAPAPDASNASLEWIEPARALVGVPLGDGAVRVALRPADLTLLILDATNRAFETLDLRGETLQSGLAWLTAALAHVTGAAAVPLARPPHELPEHPVGSGAPFPATDDDARALLADIFSMADRQLRALAASVPGASPVRCWPHHFDIATLVALDSAKTPGEISRSIGVGLSAGDASYAGGYWYVTPWPCPAVPELPPLAAGGTWHRAGWLGAVLPLSHPNARDAARSSAFLESAIAACRALLREAPVRAG